MVDAPAYLRRLWRLVQVVAHSLTLALTLALTPALALALALALAPAVTLARAACGGWCRWWRRAAAWRRTGWCAAAGADRAG